MVHEARVANRDDLVSVFISNLSTKIPKSVLWVAFNVYGVVGLHSVCMEWLKMCLSNTLEGI